MEAIHPREALTPVPATEKLKNFFTDIGQLAAHAAKVIISPLDSLDEQCKRAQEDLRALYENKIDDQITD